MRLNLRVEKICRRFQNSALFSRLDGFLERCHDVLDLMQTIVQFNKLEKIEVGGTKGKRLTENVQEIYLEFIRATETFKRADYNLMDVESKQFDEDFYSFRCCTNELERRLASIIVQAFDDSTTVLGCFKLFDAFGTQFLRQIVLFLIPFYLWHANQPCLTFENFFRGPAGA
jgi:dynein heavy chain